MFSNNYVRYSHPAPNPQQVKQGNSVRSPEMETGLEGLKEYTMRAEDQVKQIDL